MKKYQSFLSENFQFLEVNFSIYLNRRVFVMMLKMNSILPKCTLTGIFFVNLFIVITCLYRTDTFIASTGTRRQPVFKTTTSKSILSCCSVCALQTECYAMNFNDETNTCELVDIPATATEENLDGNWITYIRDGKSPDTALLTSKSCHMTTELVRMTVCLSIVQQKVASDQGQHCLPLIQHYFRHINR